MCHPHTDTTFGCSRCGRAFCGSCLTTLRGQWLCGYCKGVFVHELSRGRIDLDRRASEARSFSLVGLVWLGFILEPIALVRAISALRDHRRDAGWPDRWKAVTGLTIALPICVGLLTYLMIIVGVFLSAAIAAGR